jgi:hypothetical protein
MTSNFEQLTAAVRKAVPDELLENLIRSKSNEIEEALRTRGEYVLTDQKGRSYRITSTNGNPTDKK